MENIKRHIDKLKHTDWQRLFDLILRIEKTRKFGEFRLKQNKTKFIPILGWIRLSRL